MTAATGALVGRHAVVTGGGRGIGAAIAEALAAEGAAITIMGRTLDQLIARAEAMRRSGARVEPVACDVGDQESVARAFPDAVGRLGPVHILINNAGVSDAAAVSDITVESFERTLRVNLTGTLLCTQQVLPGMIAAGWGRIVNVASTAGLRGYANVATYCASKHGVVGLTRAIALEVAAKGVTVNAVCPGYTDDTDMLRAAVSNVSAKTGKSAEDARSILAKKVPRGSLITRREVSDAVVWLCSPAASAMTGQAIAIAGGEVMA